MIIKVHMLAFMDKGTVRNVEVPDNEIEGLYGEDGLGKVFYYGQNIHAIYKETKNSELPSVSVKDVIEYSPGEYWNVDPIGFHKITTEEFEKMEGGRTKTEGIF